MDRPLFERPPFIEQIRAEFRGLVYRPAKRIKNEQPPDPREVRRLFTVYNGNRWIELGEREPSAKMLFGEFWYEHELCFLFSNTNMGKSILAVQIGNAIACGAKTGPFNCEAKGARVLYADFELSNLQFHLRYGNPSCEDQFHDNFFRAQFNPTVEIAGLPGGCGYGNDDLLISALEYRIRQLDINVLIIDNISCFGGGTGSAKGALRIINKLNVLRAEYKLSILVLAHTPKSHSPTQPLSINDLHGSKLLVNFADSAFSIGISSTDSTLRYLKQIKQRSNRQIYGGDNVCLCRIQTHHSFMQFEFLGNAPERVLLLNSAEVQREKLAAQIVLLYAEGLTQRQVSERLGVALGTVNKVLKG